MSIEVSDVVRVTATSDMQTVNDLLTAGWKLLAVVQDSRLVNGQVRPVIGYVLGLLPSRREERAPTERPVRDDVKQLCLNCTHEKDYHGGWMDGGCMVKECSCMKFKGGLA